ncbi:hypothetical protein DB41_FQ00080 [Neochlamydia sp. TUME1]|uniref:hypothetical protein n=1 Tax=Neochlamydia sp. TUME1 TaxID=1478174 RepID=UPI0005805613|nr:hypothetical protein [Neochlamydia sp. TUME1]KIC76548.1 hypothetical protein DB41_FQ00080 [Neochlamydia sp. TUME1]
MNPSININTAPGITAVNTNMQLMQPIRQLEVQDIKEAVELCLDNEGVILLEEYQEMSLKKLEEHFKKQIDEFFECDKAAQAMLKNNADSLEYSQCVSEAEKKVENINNIINALSSMQQYTESYNLQQEKVVRLLQDMRSSIPLGNSIILRKDIEMMRAISSIPQDKIYFSPAQGTFYEPQISAAELAGWFHKQIIEECYEGVSIARKMDCMYSYQLNTMCTIIGLKKKKNKGGEEMIKKRSSFRKTIKGYTSKADKQEMESLSSKWRKLYDYASAYYESMLRHSKEKSLEEVKVLQTTVLKEISKELPNMLTQWKYEKCEVGTSEELIKKYGASPNIAREADYIILFHIKYE